MLVGFGTSSYSCLTGGWLLILLSRLIISFIVKRGCRLSRSRSCLSLSGIFLLFSLGFRTFFRDLVGSAHDGRVFCLSSECGRLLRIRSLYDLKVFNMVYFENYARLYSLMGRDFAEFRTAAF